jgi:predicted glycoside hydrolase/deacetylase ChbG (UPF0249 family)
VELRVHADDFGVSRGVTEGILRCIDEGPVRSVSVLATGAAFDEAIAALRARPHVAVSVHLNLIEGRALTTGAPLRHTFLSMLRAPPPEAFVRAEWQAQIRRVRDALGAARALRLDSHGHVHHLPALFGVARDLCREHHASLRLAREPSFIAPGITPSGILKHGLLNVLSARSRRHLDGVESNDWLIGVLLTGRMSAAAIDAALGDLGDRAGSAEILFHPGGARYGEEELWSDQPGQRAYYFSRWRRIESERLRSDEMAECLARWGVRRDR